MNLGASAIVLRPRGMAEILDLACRFSVSVAVGLYARLALAVLLPILAGCLALRHAAGWSWPDVWWAAIVAGAIAQGVFTISVGRLLFSEAVTVGQALRLFGRRLGSYLAMLLLGRAMFALVAFLLGQASGAFAVVSMLLALPFVWPRLYFVHEASLLEGAGATEALRRSARFVQGRGGTVFGVLVSLLLTQAAFVVVAEILCQFLVSDVLQLGKPFGSLLNDGGSPYALAGLLLSVPYVATARFLEYIDARTRSDGWDVQLRFMAVASAAEPRREEAT